MWVGEPLFRGFGYFSFGSLYSLLFPCLFVTLCTPFVALPVSVKRPIVPLFFKSVCPGVNVFMQIQPWLFHEVLCYFDFQAGYGNQ